MFNFKKYLLPLLILENLIILLLAYYAFTLASSTFETCIATIGILIYAQVRFSELKTGKMALETLKNHMILLGLTGEIFSEGQKEHNYMVRALENPQAVGVEIPDQKPLSDLLNRSGLEVDLAFKEAVGQEGKIENLIDNVVVHILYFLALWEILHKVLRLL